MKSIEVKKENTFPLKLTINGQKIEKPVQPFVTLLDFLRKDIGITGPKQGCGVGECGACTVIMDGKPVRSCQILAIEANGSKITTIEGISKNGKLHPAQKAFVETSAVQCGFCTPGFIMADYSLYERKKNPTKDDITEAMGGHICRCTGYKSIFDAFDKTGKLLKKK